MKSAFRNRSTRLSVEALEDRCVPAGNILVNDAEPWLIIRGDQQDNDVQLLVAANGDVTVASNTGTINGVNGPLVIPAKGGYSWFEIETDNGDDTVLVQTASFYHAATYLIATGNGNDRVTANLSSWNLSIRTGRGDDTVVVQDSYVRFLVDIKTHDGNDVVSLKGSNAFGQLGANLGAGDDRMQGDSNPGASITWLYPAYGDYTLAFSLSGDEGDDSLENLAYFSPAYPHLLINFESVG